MVSSRLRNILVLLASLLGVANIVNAPFIKDATAISVAIGVMFFVGAGLARSGRERAGAVIVGFLALFLVVGFFGWQWRSMFERIVQIGFLVASLAALATSIGVLSTRRRTAVTA